MPERDSQHRIGLICAVSAHCLWGFFPLYWNLLSDIPSVPLAAHRVVWACLFLTLLVPVLIWRKQEISLTALAGHLRSPRVWGLYALSAGMLAINWLAFIWAVNHGAVLQASLGYYINPLLSIMLGVLVLGERLQTSQWCAVGIAAFGVLVMTVAGGGLPWASLAMACAFATYGLIKKKTPLPSLSGLWLEVLILCGPALLFLLLVDSGNSQAAIRSGTTTTFTVATWLLLLGGGAVPILPLTLFGISTKRLPLSTVGVLQYIGPTLQFLVGTVVNHEPFGLWRLAGFACVWTGSILYLIGTRRHSLRTSRAAKLLAESTPTGSAPPKLSSPPSPAPSPSGVRS
jgi:chloramphenicol-sensitive protein RarD